MKSEYTIHRSEKNPENPYAQISRKMAQDSSLSFQARGLLLYVLSKPRAWRGKTFDLQREGGVKSKALKTIIDELIENRYVVRHETRNRRGRFDYTLEVFEDTALNDSPARLTVPPSRGGGTDTPSRLPREGERIEEGTCAGARSSLDHKELNTQEVCADLPTAHEGNQEGTTAFPKDDLSSLPGGNASALAAVTAPAEFSAARSGKFAARPGARPRIPKAAPVIIPVPDDVATKIDRDLMRQLGDGLNFERGEQVLRIEAWRISRQQATRTFPTMDAMWKDLRGYLVNCDLNKRQRRAS